MSTSLHACTEEQSQGHIHCVCRHTPCSNSSWLKTLSPSPCSSDVWSSSEAWGMRPVSTCHIGSRQQLPNQRAKANNEGDVHCKNKSGSMLLLIAYPCCSPSQGVSCWSWSLSTYIHQLHWVTSGQHSQEVTYFYKIQAEVIYIRCQVVAAVA